jgi:hypothetical protein
LDGVEHDLQALRELIAASLRSDSIQAWDRIETRAQQLLDTAKECGSDVQANCAWYLHCYSELRRRFIESFNQIKGGEHYQAWCNLEQVEIAIAWLERNAFYDGSKFEIVEWAETVGRWQSLYPYKLFLSPEFAIKKAACGVCGIAMDPWSPCIHEVGRVYRGQPCTRRILDAQVLSISLVTDPVQKYSVPFIRSEGGAEKVDHYDYSVLKFAVDRLASSVSRWSVRWMEVYRSHELYRHVASSDSCPCGSGRPYNSCCVQRPGVLAAHLEFDFVDPPDPGLPKFQLPEINSKH